MYRSFATDGFSRLHRDRHDVSNFIILRRSPEFALPSFYAPSDFLLHGYITDTAGQPIPQVSVHALWAADTTENALAVTDNNGYYEIESFIPHVGISGTSNQSQIEVTWHNGSYTIDITSQNPVFTGNVYSLTGQKMAVVRFFAQGENKFSGSFNVKNANHLLLFTDGQHVAIKLHQHLLSNSYSKHYSSSKSPNFKSGMLEDQNIMLRISHPDTLFQPVDTTLTNIDTAIGGQFDFVMQPWPVFFAHLNVNVSNAETGNPVDGAVVNVCENDGTIVSLISGRDELNVVETHGRASLRENDRTPLPRESFAWLDTTNTAGNATIDSIPIPPLETNRLVADTLLFQITIARALYDTLTDTIALTNGIFVRDYQMMPQSQNFHASLSVLAQNSITLDSIANANVQLWQKNTTDTVSGLTGTDGTALFDSIPVPNLDALAPDTVWFYLLFSKDSLQTTLDSIQMTAGEYQHTAQITPEPVDFYAQLNLNVINADTDNPLDSATVIVWENGSNDRFMVEINGGTIVPLQSGRDGLIVETHGHRILNVQKHGRASLRENDRTPLPRDSIAWCDTTNTAGNATIDSIPIPNHNEITPDTISLVRQITKPGFYTCTDTVQMTAGTHFDTLQLEPSVKPYTLIVHSTDDTNDLDSVQWELLDATDTTTVLANGNTGANCLDTVQLVLPVRDVKTPLPRESFAWCIVKTHGRASLSCILKTTKTEYQPGRFEIQLTAYDTLTKTTVNNVLEYLYSIDVSANDLDNGVALDSLQVEMYDTQGNLLGSANSLEDTLAHLEITRPGHEKDVKFVLKRNNYVQSDTLNETINESLDNEFSYEMEKEKAVAYFWRGIMDPLNRASTTANIIIENAEFNYSDTIFGTQHNTTWKDTVPVNTTGSTEYTMKIIPHVAEGTIPLYTEEKTFQLTPNQTIMGDDLLTALEQEQKLKGFVKKDKQNLAGALDVVIKDYDGNVIDSIRTTDGYYKMNNTLPIAEEGTGFEGYIVVKPVDDASTHFGVYKLPITTKEMSIPDITNLAAEGDTRYHGRPIVIPEKLTSFEDSTQTVNFMLTERVKNDAFSGQDLTVNPYHIQWMEGEGINSELMRYGVQNVYLNGNVNVTEYDNFLNHIRNLFDYEFNENRVSEQLPNTLTEDYSLQSDANKERLGFNIRDGPNSTQTTTTVSEEGMGFNIGAIIDISLSDYPGAAREYVGRTLEINAFPSSVRESYMNSSMPSYFPDTLNIEDRVYTKMFIDHREEQVKGPLDERVHNNLGYLRKAENFYNGQTLEEMYGSKK